MGLDRVSGADHAARRLGEHDRVRRRRLGAARRTVEAAAAELVRVLDVVLSHAEDVPGGSGDGRSQPYGVEGDGGPRGADQGLPARVPGADHGEKVAAGLLDRSGVDRTHLAALGVQDTDEGCSPLVQVADELHEAPPPAIGRYGLSLDP
jgi:hypothetical protein